MQSCHSLHTIPALPNHGFQQRQCIIERPDPVFLLCVVLGNVSDIRQTLEIVILSPDYGGIFLSSGKNNAIGQRQFVENTEFGGILSQIRI